MRDFERILDTYDALAGLIRQGLREAERCEDPVAEATWTERQRLLDYAFYVLLFAQFEASINERFITTRDARCSSRDWAARRGWDIYEGRKAGQIPFETRLALVTDRRGDAYRRILSYYALRNHVAHGGLHEPVRGISRFAKDLQGLEATLVLDA